MKELYYFLKTKLPDNTILHNYRTNSHESFHKLVQIRFGKHLKSVFWDSADP